MAALERLDQRVDWESRDRGKKGRMRQTLEPVADLLARLGAPQRSFRCVHVGGTKGKGSVASLIAVGLRRSGARVGVYGSPHVESIHERVLIAGRPIGDEALAGALTAALDAQESATRAGGAASEATWFDVLTAAAFTALAEAGVEWAVVECGLGGRLDSTNVIRSELAVLTNIDLEHTAVLGDTHEAIATEKAGIIEPGSVVVSSVGAGGEGRHRAAEVVARAAQEAGARLVTVNPDPELSIERRNVALALAALGELGIEAGILDASAVAEARLPGRLEKRWAGEVPVVLDGAHVPRSLGLVLRDLEEDSDLDGRPAAILGVGRDKDVEGLLKLLVGRVDRVLCTSLGTGPVLSPEALCERACRAGLPAEAVADPVTALEMALQSNPWVLVTGSLHLIGELRGKLAAVRNAGC